MAAITCLRTTGRVTLTGTTVDTVTIGERGPVTVCNWTGSANLTVTLDQGPVGYSGATAPPPGDPVSGAAETWAVPAGTARRIDVYDMHGVFQTGPMSVKVLGNGNVYSVDRG